jgi:hypothetical protein
LPLPPVLPPAVQIRSAFSRAFCIEYMPFEFLEFE